MKLIVNPHKIAISQEEAVNEKEINVSECEFEFAEEMASDDFVKEAYFTLGDESYKKIIVNNKCTFPQEVLVKPATIELGVVVYYVEDEEELIRYNPTPVYFKTDLGSLKEAENSEEPTPSEMEQYEQALQDGLSEVNDKLDAMDTALRQVDNLDIDANKAGNTATITITDKTGTQKSVQIQDGVNGINGKDGKDGKDGENGQDGITPTIGENGNWYLGTTDTGKPSRGATGQTGATGQIGPAGADGISPTASVSKSGSVATISITDKNGTTTATVNDGTNGTNGQDGVGVPSGGTTGQILAKTSDTDYATQWINAPSGGADIPIYMLETSRAIWDAAASTTTSNDANAIARASEIINTMYNSTRKYGGILYFSTNTKYNFLMLLKDTIATNKTQFAFYSNASAYQMTYSNRMFIHRVLRINGSWTNGVFTCTSMNYDVGGDYNFDNLVSTNTIQYINAKKTFSTLPESSVTPTTNNQLVNKKYVDDLVGNINTILATLTTPSSGGE